MTKEETKLKCPFCGGKPLPEEEISTVKTIDELIAVNYIPRSKIEAKIDEIGLSDIDYKNNLGTYEQHYKYEVLQELLEK